MKTATSIIDSWEGVEIKMSIEILPTHGVNEGERNLPEFIANLAAEIREAAEARQSAEEVEDSEPLTSCLLLIAIAESLEVEE